MDMPTQQKKRVSPVLDILQSTLSDNRRSVDTALKSSKSKLPEIALLTPVLQHG